MLAEETAVDLAMIGQEMVVSNNQATSWPVWMVGTRFFLSEPSAKKYAEENHAMFRVVSAYDNPHIKTLMLACLQAARLMEHPQTKNAYIF